MTKNSSPNRVSELAQQAQADAPYYLTEKEFCARYQIPTRTVVRWRTNGEGPAFVRCGPKLIRYRLADAEAWAAARTFRDRAAERAARPVAA